MFGLTCECSLQFIVSPSFLLHTILSLLIVSFDMCAGDKPLPPPPAAAVVHGIFAFSISIIKQNKATNDFAMNVVILLVMYFLPLRCIPFYNKPYALIIYYFWIIL